jgi:DNA-binding MarR family transcriptional regulator
MNTDFDNNLGFLLNDAARLVRYRFDARAREMGVTRPQWRLLLILRRCAGQTQAMLAQRLEVERITLTRMIDRMEEAGLIERRADPADRRVWRIYPTEKSAALTDRLAEIGGMTDAELLAILSPQEQGTLRSLLDRIREQLSRRGLEQETAA